jgi:hypothetical protein
MAVMEVGHRLGLGCFESGWEVEPDVRSESLLCFLQSEERVSLQFAVVWLEARDLVRGRAVRRRR